MFSTLGCDFVVVSQPIGGLVEKSSSTSVVIRFSNWSSVFALPSLFPCDFSELREIGLLTWFLSASVEVFSKEKRLAVLLVDNTSLGRYFRKMCTRRLTVRVPGIAYLVPSSPRVPSSTFSHRVRDVNATQT